MKREREREREREFYFSEIFIAVELILAENYSLKIVGHVTIRIMYFVGR